MNRMPELIEYFVGSGRIRTINIANRGLKRRYRAERRLKIYVVTAIVLSLVFFALLIITIVGHGYSAFQQTEIKLDIYCDPVEFEGRLAVDANYLAIVKHIAQAHGGRMTVESELGIGSTFTLHLPNEKTR